MAGGARDRLLALAIVGLLGLGVATWAFGRPNVGLTFVADGRARFVVTSVQPGSIAWSAGARPGMVVVGVDGGGATGVDPTGRTVALLDEEDGRSLVVTPFSGAQGQVLPALWAALALAVLLWHVRRRFGGQPLADTYVVPVALAAMAPLALVPAAAFGSALMLAVGSVAWPLAAWPLAAVLAGHAGPADSPVPGAPSARLLVRGAILVAIGLAPLLFVLPGPATPVVIVREALVAVALLGPIVLSAPQRARDEPGWSAGGGQVIGLVGVVATALAPLVIRLTTIVPVDGGALVFVVFSVAAAAFVLRFGVSPLARVARTALRQRDLVGASAEVERRRIAADLHDGPLQSLTLLAYRLDAAGDAENAELARDVVTELRAITSALRLPVVDDLGAGPALEWLTTRVGHLAGTPIELVRADTDRPPIEVEHAIFRVAQEALTNATRHGRPPIGVRYDASVDRAQLVVFDSGSARPDEGLAPEPGLGLIGMRERAHAIGATLDIGSSPAGTRIALVWPMAM